MLVPALIGGGLLAVFFYNRRPPKDGFRLRSGEKGIITSYLTPTPTATQWAQMTANNNQGFTFLAALFPADSGYMVTSISPAPALGHYSVIVEATKTVTYKPRSVQAGPYTITDEAARKV